MKTLNAIKNKLEKTWDTVSSFFYGNQRISFFN